MESNENDGEAENYQGTNGRGLQKTSDEKRNYQTKNNSDERNGRRSDHGQRHGYCAKQQTGERASDGKKPRGKQKEKEKTGLCVTSETKKPLLLRFKLITLNVNDIAEKQKKRH